MLRNVMMIFLCLTFRNALKLVFISYGVQTDSDQHLGLALLFILLAVSTCGASMALINANAKSSSGEAMSDSTDVFAYMYVLDFLVDLFTPYLGRDNNRSNTWAIGFFGRRVGMVGMRSSRGHRSKAPFDTSIYESFPEVGHDFRWVYERNEFESAKSQMQNQKFRWSSLGAEVFGVGSERKPGQKKKTPSPGPQEGQQYLVPHGTIEPTQGQAKNLYGPWACQRQAPPKPKDGIWREPGLAMPKSKAPPPMPKTPAVLTRLAQAKEAGLQETGLHSKSLGPSAKVIPAPPAQATPRQPVTGGAAGPGAKGQGASETPGDGKAVAAAEAVPMTYWTEVQTEEGDIYYHNEETDETAWELPPGGQVKKPEAEDWVWRGKGQLCVAAV
eukprot:g11205.t1